MLRIWWTIVKELLKLVTVIVFFYMVIIYCIHRIMEYCFGIIKNLYKLNVTELKFNLNFL